ncbi:hypothetical protein, partial [Mesorhizobium sp. M7A.F.Ca.CA.003.01.2.1]|uniref:hypothetical protein n=1 Tax=Mesorhizobium sp. M7A.F.Ca.CA.003.01.2.1 TaxID=2496722 RepID=UPI0019D15A98
METAPLVQAASNPAFLRYQAFESRFFFTDHESPQTPAFKADQTSSSSSPTPIMSATSSSSSSSSA